MRRKNIAIVAHGGVGGGNFSQGMPALVDLIERLSLNNNVTVFIAGLPDPMFLAAGYNIIGLKIPHSANFYRRLLLLMISLLKNRQRFDVIHSIWGYPWCLPALLKGMLTSTPVVISLRGGEAANLPGINYGAMRKLTGRMISLWAYRRAKVLTCLTAFQAGKLKEFGLIRKIEIVPNGADPEKFPFVKKEFTPAWKFLYVGHLTRVKDQGTLLKTFKIISDSKNCSLKIIGQGEEEENLRRLCRQLGLDSRVEFTGFVLHTLLPEHFREAHFLLHTSLWEGQGVVVAEAAASGTLVCGTRTGLISDLGESCTVNEETGQPEKLAAKVLEIMENGAEIRKKLENAYLWSQSHTAQKTADSFEEIYNAISA
jgi:glycosyltransferase involved in cell wall biosynthesis